MKTIKSIIGLCAIAIIGTSCHDGKQQKAKHHVESYSNYVDSISNLDLAEAHSNWQHIESKYEKHKSLTSENLQGVQEREALQNEVDNSTVKFEAYKEKIMLEKQNQDSFMDKNNFRTSLLGKNYVNDDMAFEWIDKNNILSVYQNFVNTVEANKDDYSREDWDEIKLLYEAIDTRKNTVENEGLSSEDNRKIAALKLKFAPMYTMNRMGTKTDENANAKKQ
ncbi:hypothetical protein APS56_08345 [Pseudalgibacter alginicilyticus]|uniref:Lipoprotein n=1 Tax=Pseudalgibacter alginicilyticus TaxID=1736674 RepID=A0A0N7HYF8_9FLAO|nr:hypothetical protein [Pseudalgibacter alginicilyticus]ALJ05134.1 hypothetical protein APS56_08345 [Pseudalgibacter alginicilyticus]